jgi:predicted RNA-binding protein
MCLSKVFVVSGGVQEEIMREVAKMQAEGEGFRLFGLFGETKTIRGRIKRVDFIDEHTVVLESDERKNRENPG